MHFAGYLQLAAKTLKYILRYPQTIRAGRFLILDQMYFRCGSTFLKFSQAKHIVCLSTCEYLETKKNQIYRNSFLLLTKRFSKQVDVTLYLCDRAKLRSKLKMVVCCIQRQLHKLWTLMKTLWSDRLSPVTHSGLTSVTA